MLDLKKLNSLDSVNIRNNFYKLKLTKKSKWNLALKIIIIALFSIFFAMGILIYSKLESIELKLYSKSLYNLSIDYLQISSSFKSTISIILIIIIGLDSITIYMSFIYLVFHPFIGLKLVLVVNLSHYLLVFIKIILQAHRPFWDLIDEKSKDKLICENDYASPCEHIFYFCFFTLYSIISVRLLKNDTLNKKNKVLIFSIHFIFILGLMFIYSITLEAYIHQLVFTIILSFVLLCFLIMKEKAIHNFIFHALKNIYNTRLYKMKIFFYVTGLLFLSILSLFFIDENELYTIKTKLKDIEDCSDENFEVFGIKKSFMDISYIFGITGAFWGAAFTVEHNIGKWWGINKKKIIALKLLIIIIVNSVFIVLKYILPTCFSNYEFMFFIGLILNFSQNFCSFGIIPLIFEKIEINLPKKMSRKASKTLNISRDDKPKSQEISIFRNSIFEEEKVQKKEYEELIDLSTFFLIIIFCF